jgi:hypothetical protein
VRIEAAKTGVENARSASGPLNAPQAFAIIEPFLANQGGDTGGSGDAF